MKNAVNNPTKTIEDYLTPPDVHETFKEKRGGVPTLIVSIITCLFEGLLLYGVLHDYLSPLAGLALHGVIVLLLGLYMYLLIATSEGRFALLILGAVATVGPFGAAGVTLTIITYLWSTRHSSSFKEWFASIFPQRTQSEAEHIYNDIQVGRDESSQNYSVISFLDVLSFGSTAQKRQALTRMTANFHPNFAPAFRKALTDEDNMIRVQAATGISKVEAHFLSRLMTLTELKTRNPKDPLITFALADHYDNYAYMGLLDLDREQSNRQKAVYYYNEYLELVPSDILARTRIGRIMMRNKEYESASEWFRMCINQGFTSETIAQWYSEALFACGHYDELRRFRSAQAGGIEQPSMMALPNLHNALELWGENPL